MYVAFEPLMKIVQLAFKAGNPRHENEVRVLGGPHPMCQI
jgi:hypothetical protein